MLKLYQREECPYCHKVREKLTGLQLDCLMVNVPKERPERTGVFQVSGQYAIPVLVDGDRVITESDRIVKYLEEKYGGVSPLPLQSFSKSCI